MSAGFSRHQLKKLATGLDPARVHSRQQDGKTLSYIEGWFVLAEANRIFGYDGWDREMVHCEKVFERKTGEGISCGYVARVRLRVRASATTIVREGTGFGQASAATQGDAHERALKAAETDATKRALVTFGGRFGLMLYDKEQRSLTPASELRARQRNQPAGESSKDGHIRSKTDVARATDAGSLGTAQTKTGKAHCQPDARDGAGPEPQTGATNDPVSEGPAQRDRATYRLVASDGSAAELRSPESFCSGLRQLIETARDRDEIVRLQQHNLTTLTALRALSDLRTARGEHYAEILKRLMEERAQELARATDRLGDPSVEGRDATAAPSAPTPSDDDAELSAGAIKSGLAAAVPVGDDAALIASDLESAIAEAKPIDDAELPKFYEPFVPVPAYPLASLTERLLSAKHQPQTAARDQGLGPQMPRSPTVVQQGGVQAEVAATPRQAAIPTRRSQITGGFSIDKSTLLIPSERRLRSKAHLQFVASKPCLVCEALPCHAHHITFAQARGLSQKVSDEFTVPLCAGHHNELHALHNEASWWRAHMVEPLAIAKALWAEACGVADPPAAE